MGDVADGASPLVWDGESSPPHRAGTTLLWRTVPDAQAEDVVAVPLLVERDADELRTRYLAWVHAIGQDVCGGRSLIERLHLRGGFSYWWMTPLSEKCNYLKSPQIDHAMRLLAFAKWAGGRDIVRLEVATSDAPLAACFRTWCEQAGIAFEWQQLPASNSILPWHRRVMSALPDVVQAFVWLAKYVVDRWAMRGVGLRAWRETQAQVTFASYSLNLQPDAASAGHFESLYWGSLPKMLSDRDRASNWIHLYVENPVLPSPGVAKEVFQRLNRNESPIRTHVTLDTFLGWQVIACSVRDWWRFRGLGRSVPRALQSSSLTGIGIGPLFEHEWQKSFQGMDALLNFLYCNLVEAAVRALPKQDVGVYLQENQPWEIAFVHAWRAAGHGRLIGVPHSSVRYWDLRYFFDVRDYAGTSRYSLPLPDQIAVNGPVAMRILSEAKCPLERLVEVEALRYLYLCDLPITRAITSAQQGVFPLRILVLTDYDAGRTWKQLNLLAEMLHLLPNNAQITVKYHPALPLALADLPGQRMKIADRPLPEMLATSDVAYASAVTSAAVDAYCAGLPVVALSDPGSLNMSPLRGLDTVTFVHSPEQLAHAFMGGVRGRNHEFSAENFFTLDETLPRWRRLLALADDPAVVRHTGD
jgi:surface carbohydrate biosynthesis protein (TIGR04326 family)